MRSSKDRAPEIVARLLRAYPKGHAARPDGSPGAVKHKDPLSEAIFTLLSQHTSDRNRDRAWASLKKMFPTWASVAAASEGALADAIRTGGLADSKAPRIKAVLAEVKRREGRHSLGRLARLSDEEARAYLLSLPGIGPKTAACVLAFSLGRERLPVDTHVHRVAIRLGLVRATATAEATQEALESLVPGPRRVPVHVALIAHGRTVCAARRPACAECVLRQLCPSASRFLR